MHRILLDTNILLDAVSPNRPEQRETHRLLARCNGDGDVGIACALSLKDVYYVMRKRFDEPTARKAVGWLTKLLVVGPISADSVFHQAAQGKYNSVLSLYHDQGHIATKTLDFERTISITNGMPILRTSVDHGTAFDIAGKNIVSEVSMVEAIRLAAKYAPNFVRQ